MKKHGFWLGDIQNLHEKRATYLLALLLCVDLIFVILNVLAVKAPQLDIAHFSVSQEGGYPEYFQYLKWSLIVLFLFCISFKRQSLLYFSWIAVFLYFLIDDSFAVHETMGAFLSERLGFTPPFRLRGQDIGELIVSGVAGIFLLFPLISAYVFGSQTFKRFSHDVFLFLLAIIFFGVFIDVLHIALKLGPKLGFAFSIFEDGGEMLVASFIVWYVCLVVVWKDRGGPYLYGIICGLWRRGSKNL